MTTGPACARELAGELGRVFRRWLKDVGVAGERPFLDILNPAPGLRKGWPDAGSSGEAALWVQLG